MTVRTAAQGVEGTQAINQSLRVVDMKDEIFHLEPKATPLTLLLNKISKESTHSVKPEWTEDEAKPISVTVAATFLTAATTFAVDDGSYVAVNDLVVNPANGEVMLVTAKASADELTVTRTWGGTAADSVDDNAELVLLGNAFPENDAGPSALEVLTVSAYNLTQIFRDKFGVSATADAIKTYGGNRLAYLQKVRGISTLR